MRHRGGGGEMWDAFQARLAVAGAGEEDTRYVLPALLHILEGEGGGRRAAARTPVLRAPLAPTVLPVMLRHPALLLLPWLARRRRCRPRHRNCC